MRPGGAVWALLATSACGIDGIDLAGKDCPCTEGFVCDVVTNTCARDDGTQEGAIQISNFRALWVTPNWIRWSWEATGDPAALFEYQLALARSPEDLAAGTNILRWTAVENPELGRFNLPRTGGVEQVTQTSSDLLEPDTVYFAQLSARDTSSKTSRSAIVSARTGFCPGPLSTAVEVGTESLPDNWVSPGCVVLSSSDPYVEPSPAANEICGLGQVISSTMHLEYEHHCSDTSGAANITCDVFTQPLPTCWENLQLTGDLDLSGLANSPAALDTAYVEFALAIDAETVPSFWGSVYVMTGNGDYFSLEPITYRADGNYRLYQIRLSALSSANDATIGAAQLVSPWTVAVGGEHSEGTTVRLDEVRIRW